MNNGFKIVKIDYKYCDYLRMFDSKVPYNAGSKELRPFVGVLFMIDDMEYFAPLSSPKPKHKIIKNVIDIIKIKGGVYGVINFNNMIPVTPSNYTLYDLDPKGKTYKELKQINLINNQLRWMNNNKDEILNKARFLYKLYANKNLANNVLNRCCNFQLLEEKCKEFNTIKV